MSTFLNSPNKAAKDLLEKHVLMDMNNRNIPNKNAK